MPGKNFARIGFQVLPKCGRERDVFAAGQSFQEQGFEARLGIPGLRIAEQFPHVFADISVALDLDFMLKKLLQRLRHGDGHGGHGRVLLYYTDDNSISYLLRTIAICCEGRMWADRMRLMTDMRCGVKRKPVLLVHGGAWAIPADAEAAHERGVKAALTAGWRVLERGGSCVDAVEEAVVAMEEDETFDAGRGSFLTSNGRVQLDALLMDGGRMKAGGVACVERLRNPIRAARVVLEKSPHVYFVGAGAEEFAAAHGVELIENRELVLDRERERLAGAQARASKGLADETFSGAMDDKSPETAYSHDTVGAVALDVDGNLAAATSTGGTLNKTPGRVGDSSLIGCGCYADNLSAAVSLTGWGEPIMKLVLGKWAVDRVARGVAPELAATEAIDYLFRRLGGHGGIILLGPDGRWGLAHNTPGMAWGVGMESGLSTGLKI
jgi:beta-aspartyl-peptidase (threonine type)